MEKKSRKRNEEKKVEKGKKEKGKGQRIWEKVEKWKVILLAKRTDTFRLCGAELRRSNKMTV